MENHQLPNARKAMAEELIRGRGMANQLLELLVHRGDHKRNNIHHFEMEEGSNSVLVLPFVEDLVHKINCAFTNTLLLLNSNSDHVSDEIWENSHNILINTKKRRGCSRKLTAPTLEKGSSIPIEDDGYAWRKYGQKMTSNSKYMRSYYKCSHKSDQGCEAIKQVQRIEDEPPLYRTSYYGHHICNKSTLKNHPEIILEPLSPSASNSTLLSFNNTFQREQENPFPSSLLLDEYSTKHEHQEVIIHGHDHSVQNQLSALENLLLFNYHDTSFDYSRNNDTLLSSTECVQFENVYEQFGY